MPTPKSRRRNAQERRSRSIMGWADAALLHTCAQALRTTLRRRQEGRDIASVEINNEFREPCRVCRGRWRYLFATHGVRARISFPGGVWCNDNGSSTWPPQVPSLQIEPVDGHLHDVRVVALENQGVLAFGVRTISRNDRPGPVVLQSRQDPTGAYRKWYSTGEPLSSFRESSRHWSLAHGAAGPTLFARCRPNTDLRSFGFKVVHESPNVTVLADRKGTHIVPLSHDELLAYYDQNPAPDAAAALRALIECLGVRASDVEA